MKVSLETKTDGSGRWSDCSASVTIIDLDIGYLNDEEEDEEDRCTFGELRAYFSPNDWAVSFRNLIYTDKMWLKTFRNQLAVIGFSKSAVEDVDYSEQGMQGYDYVSMDVGKAFLDEWFAMIAKEYK